MTDSVKDFKYQFFYVKLVNDAAKKEVAELEEKGSLLKRKFPFSWMQDHFKYHGFEYAWHAKKLVGEDAQTLGMLSRWLDKFTTRLGKIDCRPFYWRTPSLQRLLPLPLVDFDSLACLV